jgi:hypothetical protein
VTCHKEIKHYSISVTVWHTEGQAGEAHVVSATVYKRGGVEVSRDALPVNILAKFDRFADECVADYVDHLEE